jgi:ABC-type branched-subunit amino acid transport system substrate-binding protein
VSFGGIQDMLKISAVTTYDEADRPLAQDLRPSEQAGTPESYGTVGTADLDPAPVVVEEDVYVIADNEDPSSAPAFPANAPRLGALLSLTGVDRTNGEEALRGLRQSGVGTSSPLELRDTGSDPALAAQLFNSMAGDPRVLAVIAPLRNEEAAVIAPLAERYSLPVLLSSDYDGPAGRFALKATTSPSEQISALVSYVFGTLQLKRFGVLYPSDDRGHARMEKFQNEALGLGATLVGIKGYTPGKTDFISEIAAVLRWETEGGLEALYIADNARATTVLGSALHARAPRLIILAALDAVDRDLVVKAAPDLEGAIFASSDVGSPSASGSAQSGGVAAYAFEAGVIGRRALESGATSREQVLAQLRSLGKLGGVDQLFRVREGKLESVGSLPTQS